MELDKFWKAFLMICAFTFGWILCSIEKETNINVLHHGQTILNAGIRIFKGGTSEETEKNLNTSISKLRFSTSVPITGKGVGTSFKGNRNGSFSTEKPVTQNTKAAIRNSTQSSLITKAITTPAPQILRLYARNAQQWTNDDHTCKALPKFMQAVLRTSAGSLPIFIHNPKDDIHVSNSIHKYGSWEGGYIELVLTFLRQDLDLQFIDLGANLGVYSMAVAKFGWDRG